MFAGITKSETTIHDTDRESRKYNLVNLYNIMLFTAQVLLLKVLYKEAANGHPDEN